MGCPNFFTTVRTHARTHTNTLCLRGEQKRKERCTGVMKRHIRRQGCRKEWEKRLLTCRKEMEGKERKSTKTGRKVDRGLRGKMGKEKRKRTKVDEKTMKWRDNWQDKPKKRRDGEWTKIILIQCCFGNMTTCLWDNKLIEEMSIYEHLLSKSFLLCSQVLCAFVTLFFSYIRQQLAASDVKPLTRTHICVHT